MNRKVDSTGKDVSNKNEPIRFFDNPILNRLSHTSIITICIVYIPIAIYFLFQSFVHCQVLAAFLGMIIGMFIWSFVEYLVHRFAFHFKFKKENFKKIHAIFHLAHHKYPHDKTKFQTLLVVSMPFGIFIYYFFKILFGAYLEPLYAGFIVGYILYEFTHYSTHRLKMNTKITKILKQNHMRHHYFDDSKNFGVTSPIWDYVFNTRLNKIDMYNSNS